MGDGASELNASFRFTAAQCIQLLSGTLGSEDRSALPPSSTSPPIQADGRRLPRTAKRGGTSREALEIRTLDPTSGRLRRRDIPGTHGWHLCGHGY